MSNILSSTSPITRQLHTPFLERAGGDTEGDASQLALGAFLTLRAVDAVGNPAAEAETLTYQLDALEQFLHDLGPSDAEGQRLGQIASALRETTRGAWQQLWDSMLEYEEWLEGEFRLDEATDVMVTAVACAADRDPAALPRLELRHGRALRRAGDFDPASESYARAGQLALSIGDHHTERLSRIGRAMVQSNMGNLPAAEKLLDSVVVDAVQAGDTDARARASHDLAVNHLKRSEPGRAVPLAFLAYQLYETDTMRYRAIGDLGMALYQLGHFAAARDAQEIVAAGPVPLGMRISALLELLETTVAMQDRVSFERVRREIASLENSLPPDWAADYYLKLGLGFRDFGQIERARELLGRAIEFAHEHQVHQYGFEAEKALEQLETADELDVASPPSTIPADEFTPEVVEIAEELHHLRVH